MRIYHNTAVRSVHGSARLTRKARRLVYDLRRIDKNKMKKKLIIAAVCVAAAAAAAVLAGVMRSESYPYKRDCDLYFLNESESTLVAETRTVRYRDGNSLKTAVIEELIKGPELGRNKAVINKKTELLSLDEPVPSEFVADMSHSFMSGDAARDTLAAYSVIKTLCGIEGVDRVKVTVEKNDIPDSEGKAIGFLADEDINLSTDTNTSETRELTLYFIDKKTNLLAPEMRKIKVTDQLPLAQYIITELINGTTNENYRNVLDPRTTLNGVTITDNICFVNFQPNFLTRNEDTKEEELLTVYAVVNSLTQLDSIGRVQFLIDGKKAEYFGEVPFDSLFERNGSVILSR